jgi:hypothetical protein
MAAYLQAIAIRAQMIGVMNGPRSQPKKAFFHGGEC